VPPADLVANQLRFARKHFTSAVWSQWVEACRLRNRGPLPGYPEGLWARAWSVFEEGRESVEQERQRLHSRRTRDEFEYATKYGLDWPRLAMDRGESSPAPSPLVEQPAEASQLLQLQPSPSPPPCGLTGITPEKVAICVDFEQEFVAQGQNLDDVEWSAPGATPATGKGPTFKTKWTTPVGRVDVGARCGEGSDLFRSKAIVLKVEFDHDPIKTGYIFPDSAIDVATDMTVTPATFAEWIEPKAAGVLSRIKPPQVVSFSTQTGRVEFEVGGKEATPKEHKEGDASVVAWYVNPESGDELEVSGGDCSTPVVVVIPRAIKEPHPDASGPIKGENRILGPDSTPTMFDCSENRVMLATVYIHEISVEVVDQFGDLLDPLYNGQGVREQLDKVWHNIHQPINNGVYTDPVGGGTFILGSDGNPQEFRTSDDKVKGWLNDALLSPTPGIYPQNLGVDVAHHVIWSKLLPEYDRPAVKNRSVTVTLIDAENAQVDVDWP
jgi:hypothetical protein